MPVPAQPIPSPASAGKRRGGGRLPRRAALALPALLVTPLRAQELLIATRDDLLPLFAQAGAEGCFALHDAATDRVEIVNPLRAILPFIPASSFKVANALIALETGVVRDVDEVIPHGGRPQPVAAWQRDMSIRDAVPLSAVPIFQEIARRVGLARYREWLPRLAYGNADPGEDVEHFWLRGPLAISAMEQVRFLGRLATGRLDASQAAQAAVRSVLLLERAGDAALFGKTGWTGRDVADPVGWWVGWVERAGAVHAFALNMRMTAIAEAPKRITLGRALLARLGVLAEST